MLEQNEAGEIHIQTAAGH